MERKILLAGWCLTLPLYALSQDMASAGHAAPPVSDETKLINYEKIVEVADTKQDELFQRAVHWINAFYKNPGDVVREKNQDAGKILCKARFKIFNPPDKKGFVSDAGVVQYTLTLLFKDGKYKYQLTEFNWKQLSYYPAERWMNTGSPTYSPSYPHYLAQIDDFATKAMADLEQTLAVKKKEKKSDW
jgi:hypothetical protein